MPATAETVYRIASLSKPITATAILLLAQKGYLELDQKLNQYVSEIASAWQEITLRHLLMHASGVKDYLNEIPMMTQNGATPEEIAAARTLN